MAATNRGATGAVVNGYSRDTRGILAQNFPCFSYGRYSQDQRPRGKVVDFRCTIEFGHVTVRPGDIVFGDLDGVCIVPKEIEEAVFTRALEKARGERRVFEAIKGGSMCSREEVLALAPELDAIINQHELTVDRELLAAAPKLKIVANVAAVLGGSTPLNPVCGI